jgi:hypothetical protein
MAKQLKTAAQLEQIIMATASKLVECEGLTGVAIQPVADGRVPYNWTVSFMSNNSSRMCEIAIETIVTGAQRIFDLQD